MGINSARATKTHDKVLSNSKFWDAPPTLTAGEGVKVECSKTHYSSRWQAIKNTFLQKEKLDLNLGILKVDEKPWSFKRKFER